MADRIDETNPAFARSLKAALDPPQAVPREIDDRLRAAARAHLASPAFVRQRRYQLVRRLVAVGTITAAAAAIALVVWLGPTRSRPAASPATSANSYAAVLPAAAPAADATSILDAFALARQLEAGRPISAGWDIDGNGIVDRRDVDALAMRAVSLKKGEKVRT